MMNSKFVTLFLVITLFFIVFCFSENGKKNNQSNGYVPIYVMMPLSVVSNDGKIYDWEKIQGWLRRIKDEGNADGIMLDCWWGIVQRFSDDSIFDWNPYYQIIDFCSSINLKVQIVMSFHQCGTQDWNKKTSTNNDDCHILLPPFIRSYAESSGNYDIFYTDKYQVRDKEYLTMGIDDKKIFPGNKSPMDYYYNFMLQFSQKFDKFFPNTIVDVELGLGPSGELRYPSIYYPSVGKFQCYDKYLLSDYRNYTSSIGHSEWDQPPHDAGDADDKPFNLPFWKDGFKSNYGKTFLWWYHQNLLKHTKKMTAIAKKVFNGKGIHLSAKIAGIHWWYLTESHASENKNGYYNTWDYNGYRNFGRLFKELNLTLCFTCFEMHDSEQQNCGCSPEKLVNQVRSAAWEFGTRFSAENALEQHDDWHYDQIVYQSKVGDKIIDGFTFLRLGDALMEYNNFNRFKHFVWRMHNLNNENFELLEKKLKKNKLKKCNNQH